MKKVLYILIGVCFGAVRSRGDSSLETNEDAFAEEGYNLLMTTVNNIDTELVELEGDAFRIRAPNITVSTKTISLDDKRIYSPLILDLTIKLVGSPIKPSCLFTIVSDAGDVDLQLCFGPIGANYMRLFLYSEHIPDGKVEFTIPESQEWRNYSMIVEKKFLALRLDCLEYEVIEFNDDNVTNIHISPDSVLYLGNSDKGNKTFEGLVKNIVLYSKVDSKNLEKYICADGFALPKSNTDDLDDGNNFLDGGELNTYPPSMSSPITSDIKIAEKGDKGERGEKGDKGLKGNTGDKGEKGKRGISESVTGPQGPPGPQGEQGPIGVRGLKGTEGSCQCSESVVSSLLKSMNEMRGLPGDPGPPGEEGVEGRPGMTGLPGKQGERGPEGLKGELGERGNDGNPGRDGIPGLKGEPGRDGAAGPQGPQGLMGLPGPPGPVQKEIEEAKEVAIPGVKGEMGPVGPPGTSGDKGGRGEKGEKGQQGLKGEKGDRGYEGPQGPRGEKGDIGQTGLDGLPGTHGNHGTPGKKGDKGDRGERGDLGPPGMPAKLSSFLDLDDSDDNSAIFDKLRGLWKGDMGSAGPKGDKGNLGPIGPVGPLGTNGEDGKPGERGPQGHKGDQGPEGPRGYKGDQGEPGAPGNVPMSAISLMKGPKGEQGRPGHVGSRGPKGTKGMSGNKGSIGQKGEAGKIGEKGDKGQKGEEPIIDLEKVKGEKGVKGDRGQKGDTGEMGLQGPPGYCNESNVISLPGPPGPPGPPGAPGTSVTGPKGEPGGIISQNTLYAFVDNDTGASNEDEDFYTAATVIFKTVRALYKRTLTTAVGTLAYVLEEKILLLRVEHGWQHVSMGSLMDGREYLSTPPTRPLYTNPTTTPQPKSYASEYLQEGSYIRLVALNEPYAGNMLSQTNRTGRSAADHKCYKQALRSGFKSSFVAFLANKVEDLRSVVKITRDIPVVNIYDNILFDSWSQMFDGTEAVLNKGYIYSFDRRNVLIDPKWPTKAVWHGSDASGTRAPQSFCDQWQSDSPTSFGAASSLTRRKLLGQEMYPCDSKLIVLCVESTSTPQRRRQRHPQTRKRLSPHDKRIRL